MFLKRFKSLSMSIFKQKTISKNIYIEGVGLHNGKKAKLTIKPAEPNNGIVFKRVDLNYNNEDNSLESKDYDPKQIATIIGVVIIIIFIYQNLTAC